MTISMYKASVPVFIHELNNLKSLLKKGEEFTQAKKIAPEVMLNSRLAVDMLPLTKQIHFATDSAKGAAARLAGVDVPKFEDDEQTFAEFYTRIDKTVDFLKSIKPEQIDGSEERTVVMKLPSEEIRFTGINYLMFFVHPNIAFHVTTAYNILRHNGVDIGKRDYLGPIPKL